MSLYFTGSLSGWGENPKQTDTKQCMIIKRKENDFYIFTSKNLASLEERHFFLTKKCLGKSAMQISSHVMDTVQRWKKLFQSEETKIKLPHLHAKYCVVES